MNISPLIIGWPHHPSIKPRQRQYKKRTQIHLMNINTKIVKKLANQIQQYMTRIYTMTKWDLSWVCKPSSTIKNQ